jgi:hypothetical protein
MTSRSLREENKNNETRLLRLQYNKEGKYRDIEGTVGDLNLLSHTRRKTVVIAF